MTDDTFTTTRRVEVLDTTLRDGEQTPGLSYTPGEKLHLARVLLTRLGVDRIEIASARTSDGERAAVRRIVDWARAEGMLERVELLGFCDGGASARWMAELGAARMNLLTKGSEEHCKKQLRMTLDAHLSAIVESVAAADACGVQVSGAYLEDWSRGITASRDHVMALTESLLGLGVSRLFLADTVGCLSPDEVRRHVATMRDAFPTAHFEFRAHDDYGLATANTLAAAAEGVRAVHASVNGLGERAGNARLCEVIVALRDHAALETGVDESTLYEVARLVETFSGKPLADNTPVVGSDVFTQTAGVHADGDRKGDLYASRLTPVRFGRARSYALGKLSGRASLDQNLSRLGILLEEHERDELLSRIVELGDQKRPVLATDLPFLINDVLGRAAPPKLVRDYTVTVRHADLATAEVLLERDGRTARARADGRGGYEALMSALGRAACELGLSLPKLLDFRVRIPPGGGVEALVETTIRFGDDADGVSVSGVARDLMAAAVIATEKMLELVARKETESGPASLA